MLKRIVSILLALLILFSLCLTACSTDFDAADTDDPSSNPSSSDPAVSDDEDVTSSSQEEETVSEPTLSPNAETTAKTGFPIVNETVTVTGMMPGDIKWEEQDVVESLEELTNIHIDMTVVETSSFTERKLVSLASDEYPDFFYMAELTTEQQRLFGQNSKALVDLLPLIKEGYAPNLSGFFYGDASDPTSTQMAASTLASCLVDGALYSLPYIYNGFDEGFIAINTAFLEKLELEVPETTDQLLETLRAVVKGNPNGNKKSKEIGIASLHGTHYLTPFMGCFGIPTEAIYLDGSTVKLGAMQPEYKDFLTFFATCFEEKLVDTRLADNVPNDSTVVSELLNNTIFMMYTGSTAVFGDYAENYDVFTLTTPVNGGEKVWLAPKDVETGTFAITDKCEYPEAMLRWADYFYSSEGQLLLNIGVEDKHHTLDGEEFPDATWKPKKKAAATMLEWLTSFSILPSLNTVTAPGFYLYTPVTCSDDELAVAQCDFRNELLDYHGGRYPTVTFTEDELAGLEGFEALCSYIDDMQLKFITGDADIEEEWDNYIAILEKYRVDSFIEIYQSAYDRYQELIPTPYP